MRLAHILFPLALLSLSPSAVQAQMDDVANPASVPTTNALPTLDTPIRQIASTDGGCAVLDKDFPGLRAHAMYPFFKSMSLNQIAAMSKGQITPDMLAQAKADLAALNASGATTTASKEAPAATPPAAMTLTTTPTATPVSATVAAAH
jgi:hypothetical protein